MASAPGFGHGNATCRVPAQTILLPSTPLAGYQRRQFSCLQRHLQGTSADNSLAFNATCRVPAQTILLPSTPLAGYQRRQFSCLQRHLQGTSADNSVAFNALSKYRNDNVIDSTTVQWNSVNESTVNKSSRLLHPICLERNRPNPFPL